MFRATSHRSVKFSSRNPLSRSPAKDGMLGSEARRIAEGSNASAHVAVTTLPAPITALSPIATPGRIIASPPIYTLRPMRIGRPNSNPEALLAASRGWSAVRI